MPTRPRDITTEEHRPPDLAPPKPVRPAFLAAFPTQVFVPLPRTATAVGRSWLADAGITDSKVSTEHLRLTRAGGKLQIEDLTSRNGTWLNGIKLTPREPVPVEDGAILRLGGTLFVYREAYAGPDKPAPPLGALVGPWGLDTVHEALRDLEGSVPWNVLVEGESGAGKELLSRHIATVYGRSRKPFASVNVAGVSPSLFEGQLFGWTRGAYTGSVEASPGILGAHAGGTVFLDELGELPLELQPKLLRFLDNHEVQPVGAPRTQKLDLLVIAATNRELQEEVTHGRFRLDMLARFRTRLTLPPLRERQEDLYAIAKACWNSSPSTPPIDRAVIDVEAIERLMLHDWPDNVRGLERIIAFAQRRNELSMSLVSQQLGPLPEGAAVTLTREAVLAALARCGENKSNAAKLLGVSRGKLLHWLKRNTRA
ncbi:sigma 54-interacting transcriptional regulator [Chondromyces crocatus]|uniref:Fis family transcriptional regulator n=1 Tax=Chondromyces crocatus TaxID=52 RepID=A0A0K1EJQ3_CHOCO|nr:sigma 54-interacting transcriptional regulator [Chondromyces crocatus]AKT41091.1 uncharacterized protein CMC5_052500 [Chondromyces crocatus]